MFRWYVINTYSGHENKVKANLEHRVETMSARARVRQVVVPTEQVTELKDGQRIQVEKRTMPGYVLVNMELMHRETAERPRTHAQFEVGESVKVISGPLSDFSGEIAEINEDAAKLKVLVSIFGRETPVEVGYDQVKKI